MRISLLWTTAVIASVAVVLNADEVDNLPFGLSWLESNDHAELLKVENSQRGRFLTAIYDKSDADKKSTIRNDVLPRCYSSWMSEKEREELESLHHSGNHEKCKERVSEIISNLPDDKRVEVQSYWSFCEHLWYSQHDHSHHVGHKHARRNVGRHTRHTHTGFDSFASEHLAWLSEDERQEIKKLHDESKEKAHARIFELFDSATGEKREKAISQLQAACRELIVNTFGEETAKNLRQLKESGKTDEELKTKINELLNGLPDDAKKAKALEYQESCDKIYKAKPVAATRRRRDQTHHHGLESKLKNEWSWLTSEQKDEVRKLKDEGKSDEVLLTKVFEFFKTAEQKDAAEDGLQQSCQGAVLTILGAEKAQILKEFMANGAKPDVYEAKVKELLNEQDKEGARRQLTKNQESCKSVFTSASRRRRDHHEHHEHSLEHYLTKHLAWLTEEQKTELRKLHEDEKDEDKLHAKVMQWYDEATGEKKEEAKAALQAGCRDILYSVIGPEKMEEIKKLKESGSAPTDIAVKVEEYVKGITDEAKVKRGRKYEHQCKKLFGVGVSRRRRDHHEEGHEATLEAYLATHLSWLTDAQKEELRKLKGEGKGRNELHAKVMEIYEALTGEVKEKATSELQESCREMYSKYFTAEQLEELKNLKESGASANDIRDKGDSFVSQISDPKKKEDATFYSGGCRKVFGVARR
ncbi:hypothetical protein M3Y94_00124800 [Aphelenchoides besseyi]|nr:hypothetical protein M3Y94_00124800 [Aphelenchoides besseyi]KAI6237399.1 Polyprotein ABA-1 [Aphelenchoides besseyi]